jgi:hypothetical protein
MTCGNIVSDTVLSAEIEFGEGGGGAAFVQGSFVADNASEFWTTFSTIHDRSYDLVQLVLVSPVRGGDKVEQRVVNRPWQMASRSYPKPTRAFES